jgi:putative ABC transport system permease protein
MRTTRVMRMWSEFVQDVRYAARWLVREPLFALVAVATLALGIGANTAAFGMVNGVLLSPLPYPQPDRLVAVRELGERGAELNAAWPNFADWRARAREATLSAHTGAFATTVLGGVEPVRPGVAQVSAEFFAVMGVGPALGRTFSAEELVPDGAPAVMVSDAFWRRMLRGEPDLSRLSLTVLGRTARVVGVMPAGFAYPGGADLWLPLEPDMGEMTSRSAHNYLVTGRLREGGSVGDARAELSAIMQQIHDSELDVTSTAVTVHDLLEHAVAGTRRDLLVLLAASGFVLLVACTNLASALLARAARRSRELAVRASLGASRTRLFRQLLTESLLLAVLGAAAGLVLAQLLLGAVLHLAPEAVPRLDEVRLDARVLGFTTLIAIATALTFGTAPALRATGAQPFAALRESGRGSDTPRQRRGWSLLVGAEVALALLLLVGAGLLVRSLWNVGRVDPGFDADGVLAVTLSLPESSYAGDQRVGYYDRLLEEVRALPGVRSAGLSRTLPLVGWDPNGSFVIDGEPAAGPASYRVVSPDFFETMRIPVVRGRTFTDADRAGALPVIVINERLAQLYFPDRDPIGSRIMTGGMDREGWQEEATIVGVVGNVRAALAAPPAAAYYLPYAQRYGRVDMATLLLRADGSPALLSGALHTRIRSLDGDVPFEIRRLRTHLKDSLADRRFMLLVLGSFAGVALLLAGVGIYGVVAFAVAQRTHEIGIRVALGAGPPRVLWLVSRSTMAGVLAGVVLGLAGAMLLTRVIAALLYGVEAVDPLTFAGVALLIIAVAWIAVLVPARRAMRVDPLTALRAE